MLKAAKVLVLDMNDNRLDYIKKYYPSVSCIKLTDNVTESLLNLLNGEFETLDETFSALYNPEAGVIKAIIEF